MKILDKFKNILVAVMALGVLNSELFIYLPLIIKEKDYENIR